MTPFWGIVKSRLATEASHGEDDDVEESSIPPAGFGFLSHRKLSLLDVKSIRGIHLSDLTILKEKLEQEASENLGMAMIYTLVSSARDWLSEHYGQDDGADFAEEEVAKEDEVIIPHGEPVTLETFVAWGERFEAELALERANLLLRHRKRRSLQEDSGSRVAEREEQCSLPIKNLSRNMMKILTLTTKTLKMTKKTCLSTTWRRNLMLQLPQQVHEARKPCIMIVRALFWIEIKMQETDLTPSSIQSPYPQFCQL
ncbi:hypothetical protein Bca4012_063878 [Brassica carinata]